MSPQVTTNRGRAVDFLRREFHIEQRTYYYVEVFGHCNPEAGMVT
jgi:hypothetical protein